MATPKEKEVYISKPTETNLPSSESDQYSVTPDKPTRKTETVKVSFSLNAKSMEKT